MRLRSLDFSFDFQFPGRSSGLLDRCLGFFIDKVNLGSLSESEVWLCLEDFDFDLGELVKANAFLVVDSSSRLD